MKKIGVFLAAIAMVFSSMLTFATPAHAISISVCDFTMRNDLLNPTWSAKCNTTKQYRARAWCQVAWAYGDWVNKPSTSKATCFLVFVDKPKSGVDFR
jgi:hypothetical protein